MHAQYKLSTPGHTVNLEIMAAINFKFGDLVVADETTILIFIKIVYNDIHAMT